MKTENNSATETKEPKFPTKANDPTTWFLIQQSQEKKLDGSLQITNHMSTGLTKREYMTIKIIAGLISNSALQDKTPREFIDDAIMITDELINQLNK
jgi:hypothetical protein